MNRKMKRVVELNVIIKLCWYMFKDKHINSNNKKKATHINAIIDRHLVTRLYV